MNSRCSALWRHNRCERVVQNKVHRYANVKVKAGDNLPRQTVPRLEAIGLNNHWACLFVWALFSNVSIVLAAGGGSTRGCWGVIPRWRATWTRQHKARTKLDGQGFSKHDIVPSCYLIVGNKSSYSLRKNQLTQRWLSRLRDFRILGWWHKF